MNRKRVSSIVLVIALSMVCSIGTCFAGTLPDDSVNTVPVYLTISGDLSIDFTISEKIIMTGTADSAIVSVSDLAITNNGTMGQIEVNKLETTTETGWSIVDAGSDFVNMAVNSKKISLVTGDHDFSKGEKVFTNDELLVDSKTTETVSFTGKACPTTEKINNLKVANVIATVGFN